MHFRTGIAVDNLQTWLRVAATALLAVWHVVPAVTQLLVLLMVCDVALGTWLAISERRYNVDFARRGAGKKMATLVMVGVAAVLTPYVMSFAGINLLQAASAFYLVPELGSVTKNAALLGAPTFPQMAMVLEYFDAFGKGKPVVPGDKIATDNQRLSEEDKSKESK